MKHYKYFALILGIAMGSTSLCAVIPEGVARNDALYMLEQMHKGLFALESEFAKMPSDPHSPEWVSDKLKTMALIDVLLRRTLVENAMRKAWPYSIRRIFVEYFINFDADLTDPQTMGFLQLNDQLQYLYLKKTCGLSPQASASAWDNCIFHH